MYCNKCGKKLDPDMKFCAECGSPVKKEETTLVKTEEVNKPISQTEVKEEKPIIKGIKNDTFWCLLSLACAYLFPAIGTEIINLGEKFDSTALQLIGAILALTVLAALPICIFAKIKYKDSKFAKYLLIYYIASLVLAIIGFILLVAICYVTCSSIDTSGCEGFGAIVWQFLR